MLINKKAVRQLISDVSPYIKQVESGFYIALDRKVRSIVLSAIKHNASRTRLTQYELAGFTATGTNHTIHTTGRVNHEGKNNIQK